MKNKEIFYSDELRQKLLNGVEKLANAVKVTMGPRGRNVLIEEEINIIPAHITKDGVTVARNVKLKDQVENMGAQLVKSVAIKTADEAGDGTTTATVLAWSIFKQGLRHVTSGLNPIELKRGMDSACDFVVQELKKVSKPIESSEQIKQVAVISANNDEKIGNLIASAMKQVGKNGVITVEEAKGMEDELEVVPGMRLERGMESAYFTTSKDKIIVEYDNPYFIIYSDRLRTLTPMIGLLEQIQRQNRPIIIIAESYDNDVLNTLVVNKLRNVLNVCAIKAPGFGKEQHEILQDIAILTGGKVFSEQHGLSLENGTLNDLGQSERVIIDLKTTTIVNGNGNKEEIENRVKVIQSLIDKTDVSNKELIEKYQKRIGKLTGGVAVLKIGAPSETELKEKRDRVDDALAATRAAVQEGIVIGGGCALAKISKKLEKSIKKLSVKNHEQSVGMQIIVNAIREPLKQIAQNAGYSGDVICEKVLKLKDEFGFDARNGEFCNMFERGIVDPVRVERVALQQAVSIASLLLTSEAGLINIDEK